MKIIFWNIIIGASLLACSTHFNPKYHLSYQTIEGQKQDSSILSLLKPYQDTLHIEFDAVIAQTAVPLLIKRPSSNLMNWCADAALSAYTQNKRFAEPVICILNTGGLRSSFGAGNLSLADFYQLMPFDNRLTLVHLPVSRIPAIANYLSVSGGEPLANCYYNKGELIIPGLLPTHQFIWVLTSDFLSNGGDKMDFFLGLEKQETNILLRDLFIAEAKKQHMLQLDTNSRYQP